jgi:hypothetical protein
METRPRLIARPRLRAVPWRCITPCLQARACWRRGRRKRPRRLSGRRRRYSCRRRRRRDVRLGDARDAHVSRRTMDQDRPTPSARAVTEAARHGSGLARRRRKRRTSRDARDAHVLRRTAGTGPTPSAQAVTEAAQTRSALFRPLSPVAVYCIQDRLHRYRTDSILFSPLSPVALIQDRLHPV